MINCILCSAFCIVSRLLDCTPFPDELISLLFLHVTCLPVCSDVSDELIIMYFSSFFIIFCYYNICTMDRPFCTVSVHLYGMPIFWFYLYFQYSLYTFILEQLSKTNFSVFAKTHWSDARTEFIVNEVNFRSLYIHYREVLQGNCLELVAFFLLPSWP